MLTSKPASMKAACVQQSPKAEKRTLWPFWHIFPLWSQAARGHVKGWGN